MAAARADAAIAAQAAIESGQGLAAVEHAVKVLGEAGSQGEEWAAAAASAIAIAAVAMSTVST